MIKQLEVLDQRLKFRAHRRDLDINDTLYYNLELSKNEKSIFSPTNARDLRYLILFAGWGAPLDFGMHRFSSDHDFFSFWRARR